jgi:hypothetical protein
MLLSVRYDYGLSDLLQTEGAFSELNTVDQSSWTRALVSTVGLQL